MNDNNVLNKIVDEAIDCFDLESYIIINLSGDEKQDIVKDFKKFLNDNFIITQKRIKNES